MTSDQDDSDRTRIQPNAGAAGAEDRTVRFDATQAYHAPTPPAPSPAAAQAASKRQPSVFLTFIRQPFT
jgi:hypothetical protein